jgi:hypothetical protein
MRWRKHFLEAWPEGRFPYLWHPERVRRCPRTACRRARRCLRPEKIARPQPYESPSCPLITDEEWHTWGVAVLRTLKRLHEKQCAEEQAAIDAERAAKRHR